ncbi:MAG: E3 ubiquitin-protein ligase [Chlamydiae bacterium]|nr:E3 ubiquitin-protein ligase [Chlamydiota bacterium]
MDICPICLEDMDMIHYNDERESTFSCFKMNCGHAYHTKCIITCLSVEGKKCPQCNDKKSPSQELSVEGLKKKYLGEIKRDKDIQFLMNELSLSDQEYSEARRQLKKDIQEFINKRKVELGMDVKRDYVLECLKRIRNDSKTIAKQKGPEYLAALDPSEGRYRRGWGGTPFERHFFGRTKAYHFCRLKNAYIHLRI